MKKIYFYFIAVLSIAATKGSAQYGGNPCMGTQTVRMSFVNGVVAGTVPTPANPVSGMTITYPNVLTGTVTQQVDAVFTLDAITWDGRTAEWTSFNPDFSTNGVPDNFQPAFVTSNVVVPTPVGTYNLFNTWTVRFYLAGTSTPAFLPIVVQTIDNDGSFAGTLPANRVDIKESISFITPPSSIVTSTGSTGTPATTQIITGNTITVNASTAAQPGVGTGKEYIAYTNFGNTSGFQFTFNHQVVFTASGANANFGHGSRQSSLHIGCDYAGLTPFTTLTLSGNVYNDIDGLTDATVDGIVINNPAGAQLYANLLSEDGKTILATVAVAADGSYSFPVGANSNYQVQLTTTPSTVATDPTTATLPSGWVATGETNNGAGTGSDGTPNLINTLVAVGTSNVIDINFGIQQPPTSTSSTMPNQVNNQGNYSIPVPASQFAGNDPSTGGTITNIRFTSFPTNTSSITINGIKYGPGFTPWPAGGVTVAAGSNGQPLVPVAVDPVDGIANVVIPFVTIDNGRAASQQAAVTVPFTIILPVNFGSFTALTKGCSVELFFETLTEQNNKHFEIEYNDGRLWKSIAILPAKNNGNNGHRYEYAFSNAANGIGYYRIKQVDKDGNSSYSNTITALVTCDSKGSYMVYPNPVKDILHVLVSGINANKVLIRLTDAAGRIMAATVTVAGNTVNVTTAGLPAGIYTLQIQYDNLRVHSQKVIKL